MHVRAGEIGAIFSSTVLFNLRPQAWDALSGGRNSRRRHFGAGDFLDLARRAGSIINQHALTKPQTNDILLAPDMLSLRTRRGHRRPAKQDAG
jgi:hypothetical protein